MRNIVLPPTPPASSAPPDVPVGSTDQPLDLSCQTKQQKRSTSPPSLTPVEPHHPLAGKVNSPPPPAKKSAEPPAPDVDKAEVEIIAMTTRIRPSPTRTSLFQPPAPPPLLSHHRHPPQFHHHHPLQRNRLMPSAFLPVEIQRVHNKVGRPPGRIPSVVHPPAPATQQQQHYRAILPDRPAVPTSTRPFLLPPLRPLAQHHWQQIVQQQQQKTALVIRPDIQLHPVRPAPQRLFYPVQQLVTGSSSHKMNTAPVAQLIRPPSVSPATGGGAGGTTTTSAVYGPGDWSMRSCVVCSRRADFRCAGCHGNAYCSTLCQVKWIDPPSPAGALVDPLPNANPRPRVAPSLRETAYPEKLRRRRRRQHDR